MSTTQRRAGTPRSAYAIAPALLGSSQCMSSTTISSGAAAVVAVSKSAASAKATRSGATGSSSDGARTARSVAAWARRAPHVVWQRRRSTAPRRPRKLARRGACRPDPPAVVVGARRQRRSVVLPMASPWMTTRTRRGRGGALSAPETEACPDGPSTAPIRRSSSRRPSIWTERPRATVALARSIRAARRRSGGGADRQLPTRRRQRRRWRHRRGTDSTRRSAGRPRVATPPRGLPRRPVPTRRVRRGRRARRPRIPARTARPRTC